MEKERELRTEFSLEEIAQKVELYNAVTKDHLKMTLVSGAGELVCFQTLFLNWKQPRRLAANC